MGGGNDPRYISDSVFLPYPFPDPTEDQRQVIRLCAERLDTHRKPVPEPQKRFGRAGQGINHLALGSYGFICTH
jgi:hypothetical protein